MLKKSALSIVVLCIVLFSTPIETYMSYALNRIFDTAIGVIAASGKGSKARSRKTAKSECFSAPRSGRALFFCPLP